MNQTLVAAISAAAISAAGSIAAQYGLSVKPAQEATAQAHEQTDAVATALALVSEELQASHAREMRQEERIQRCWQHREEGIRP